MGNSGEQVAFDRLLEHLRQSRGFDFTAYKRASLLRRVLKRMHALDITTFEEYLDYLQGRPDEFLPLFNTILINVTSFFRDADVWDTFRATVLPSLNGGPVRREPVRIWSAGCAAGQEAYSAAMMLAEELGAEAFRDRVKIYATDVDDQALAYARQATYASTQIADIPAPLLEKYFDRNGDVYTFDRELRRSLIFGRHDLIQDPPISRIDLLLCRNTLMYFNSAAQARILARFYFSVNPGGFLALGPAEMLFGCDSMFQPADVKRRIFRAVPRPGARDRLLLLAQSNREDDVPQYPDYGRLRDAAFDSAANGQIVLDQAGHVVAVNAAARRQFDLNNSDIGARIQDLELSYGPAKLGPSIDRARDERQEVTLKGVAWEQSDTLRFLDVIISPLYGDDRHFLGTRISFVDVTPRKSLQDELRHSKQEVETAYEERQSTNEELETTNEELQSTVEELETTNEELQSTNEELETMNEELQSTNEELQTMNEELRNRSTELSSTNAFLEAVFRSLRSAIIVLDREMRVQVWTRGAMNLWGLRPEEVQYLNFFSLDIGLPVGELHQPIKDVLSGKASCETVVAATIRRGKRFHCRVSVSALTGLDGVVTGVTLLMEEHVQPG
jgi:two-component system CheB/CheR fusion protein